MFQQGIQISYSWFIFIEIAQNAAHSVVLFHSIKNNEMLILLLN